MKGTYQYVFLKRIYELNPSFEVNRILLDLLDKHWNHPTLTPLDTIANDWKSVNSTDSSYRNLQRVRALIKHGSFYKSLNLDVCHNILNIDKH